MLTATKLRAWLTVAAVLLTCHLNLIRAQENIQLQIPPSLVECYDSGYFMNRDNRLPANIETLITLIEKVENSPDFEQDIRSLAVALLHRFRQDGIQRAPGVMASAGVLPYSPTGFQFPKFRILLSRLLPGNAMRFPNDTLTREERCSLHFMLSSSFDIRPRGDENQVCSKLSQYRAQRLPRAPRSLQPDRNNFIGDVEILENLNTYSHHRRSHGAALQSERRLPDHVNSKTYDLDSDWFEPETEYGYASVDNSVSQCPVENGVIRTEWGTVAAGTLMAGIAAGLQPQTVQLRTLLALATRRQSGYASAPQTATVNVDNRWAATLAGDLAEVALVQVPVAHKETATVGANGAWNSTVMPKWYFLSQRQNLEMTDAEIRGGLDGLIIAMNIATWRTQAPNMKLSQLLRMYYSLDGVLGSGIKACNRKENFPTFADLNDMIAQTSAFAQVLDREMQLHVTLTPVAIAQFSKLAANALTAYIPQYLNDVSCSVSQALPQDLSESITPLTNLYVFLDMSWQYNTVVDHVNYILKNLNVNPYGSSVTLLAAADGALIVNTTNYLIDVFVNWNATTHATFTPGFNLPTILRTIQSSTQSLMNEERTNSSVGGRSLVALLMPYMSSVSDGDSNYATTQLQYISEQIPDLYFVYYAGGTASRFSSFVRDPTQDLYSLSTGSNVASSAGPPVARIKRIQRRLINPRCGANWISSSWGTDQMAQYARPGAINFYRMAPNYFYGAGGGRFLNIQMQNSFQFVVCTSRSTPWPMQNSSTASADQNCVQLSGNTFSYDLSNACNGQPTIHQCPPLYVSVEAPATTSGGGLQTVSCSDAACQTPDQARYTVSVVNLGCYSGVAGLAASLALIALASLLPALLQ